LSDAGAEGRAPRRRRAARPLAAALALLVAGGCAGRKPAWELPPPPVVEGPIVPQERLTRASLENGLEVLVLEDHALPRLDVGVVVRRGAEVEPIEQAGALALLTDAMERGAGARDALALNRAIEELGASFSADAGWDSASVGLSGLSEDADALFALLADVVLRPRLDPAEVARARSEQLAALEQDKDQPESLLARELARTLYDGHRYGAGLAGEPESVARLDTEVLRALHARLFTPGNAILYAVGDIGADPVLAEARARFGAWVPAPVPEPGPPPPSPTPPARRVVIVDRPDLGQAQIALAHEGIARTDPDRIPITLMNTVLGGGGFLSRLMSRVRAQEGLTYSVGSSFSLRRHPGPFRVATFTRVPEAGRVVSLLLEELERMRSEPPEAGDLELVRSFSAGRFVLGLETSRAIAASLVDLDVYGLPRGSLDDYRTRLNRVTLADLRQAAREHLHPERVAIVVVGPAEALRPQLEAFGPVEVVEP
jgi:zinc protease